MNRRVIAIAVAAVLAITAVFYVALWSPQSKSLKSAHTRETAAVATQASLRSDIKTLKQEETQLPAKRAQLEKLKLALPDVPGLDAAIDNINSASITSGVDWQSFSPARPAAYGTGATAPAAAAPATGAQSVNISMTVNGSYAQLLDFANKLNAIPRLLTIDTFNISGVGGAAKITSQFTVQIFYVPNSGQPAATTPTTVGH